MIQMAQFQSEKWQKQEREHKIRKCSHVKGSRLYLNAIQDKSSHNATATIIDKDVKPLWTKL